MKKTNLEIITHRNENIHSVSFALVLPLGSIYDPKGKKGLAHLVEHMCFRRAGDLSQEDLYAKLEELGVNIRASTTKRCIKFSFIARKTVFSEVIEIFHNMLCEENYTQQDLYLEKRVIRAEILEEELTNSEIIVDSLWSKESYSCPILGLKSHIKNISLDDIVFYKKKLLQSKGTIFILGNYSEEHYKRIEELFISEVHVDKNDSKQEASFKVDRGIHVIADELEKCDVYYAFHINLHSEKNVRTAICAQMLQSMLFYGDAGYMLKIARERRGYVYSFLSHVEIIENELVFIFQFSANKTQVLKTINTVERSLKSFKAESKYVKGIRAFYCDNISLVYDNPDTLCEHYTSNLIDFCEVISPKDYADIVLSIEPYEYEELLKEMQKNRSVYIFGNLTGDEQKTITERLIR